MRRMMKEDLVDDPNSWDATTWENDQERLRVLENRVKAYLLDIERRYKVNIFIYLYKTHDPNPELICSHNLELLVL